MPPSGRLIGIGFYIGLCIALATLGGRELDRALDTGKLMTILGLVAGLALALGGGLRQLMQVLAEMDRRRTEGKKD